jgi:signal peptidase II
VKAPAYLIAIAVVLIDQISKAWALTALADGRVHPLLPGLLQQRLVFNTGAAFSLLTGNAWLLGLVSGAVALALVAWIQTGGPWHRLQWLGLGLLLGGAVGNGLDRWRLGTVVDFLEFVPISFPVFNGADIAINLAVAALVIDWLRQQQSARAD